MFASLRSASLVLAVLSASSVAPAQVGPIADPSVTVASASVPTMIEVQTFDPEAEAAPGPVNTDPLPDTISEAVEQDEPAEAIDRKADLATLVAQLRGSDPGSRELECLAVGIYFEAKSEPLIGQLAVGEVIANRARSGRFASTYCGVLFQRGQFSFIRGRSWPAVARSSRQWQNAVAIAKIVDKDLKDSAASNALFFHAKRVSPRWRLKRVASIGNHVFYR